MTSVTPTQTRRRPRGYEGVRHETIGSDITAVLRSLTFPISLLGPERVAWLEKVVDDQWYPIAELLALFEQLDGRLGDLGLRKMGRTLFRQSHADRLRGTVHSARDILFGFDDMYRHANRGDRIGGWKVISFVPGVAALEKTTPHHCVMEEGIMAEALALVGVPAEISQSQCFRRGDDLCRFVVSSPVEDHRWTGISS
jgi:hypothetical protein